MDGPGTVVVTLESKVEATHDMALLDMSEKWHCAAQVQPSA